MKIQVSYISNHPTCDKLQVWDQSQRLGVISESDFYEILSESQINDFQNSESNFEIDHNQLFSKLNVVLTPSLIIDELINNLNKTLTKKNLLAVNMTKKLALMLDIDYQRKEVVNYYLEVSNWNYDICESFAKSQGFGKDWMHLDIDNISFWNKKENGILSRLAIISNS